MGTDARFAPDNANGPPAGDPLQLVGVGRFELPASTSRTWRATKLRYTPQVLDDVIRR